MTDNNSPSPHPYESPGSIHGLISIGIFVLSIILYMASFTGSGGGPFNLSGCLPLALSAVSSVIGVFVSLAGINAGVGKSKKSSLCLIGLLLNSCYAIYIISKLSPQK